MTRFQVDSSWWRRPGANGDTVVAGSPLKIFRLTASARESLKSLEQKQEPEPIASVLMTRLLDAGAIHPVIDRQQVTLLSRQDVTVIIPTYNIEQKTLQTLVESMQGAFAVIVVDDGSTPLVTAIGDATVIRRNCNAGPATARNTALAHITTELVLFLDADTVWNEQAWSPLLGHFDDPLVGLVAPRVSSQPGRSLLARYEMSESPLDLGSQPARIRQGTRVSYVPAAALMIRTATLRLHNGFDESLRYGEDVDLVWRLDQSGVGCRYEPTAIVYHQPRSSWKEAMQQRISYGSAAACLEAKHPHAVTPLRINRWSALAWTLFSLGHPILGIGTAAGSTAALNKKLKNASDHWSLALRIAGRGNLHAGRMIASAVIRVWWPIAAVACLFSPRSRRITLVAAVVPPLIDWLTKKPRIDPATYTALKIADNVAYGSGVWKGVIRKRQTAAITPRFD